MKATTLPEHQAAVLSAHARYSIALSARDEHDKHRARIDAELAEAENALRALARRQS
jgi:hypothetical protein